MPSSPIISKLERYDWDNWDEFENIVIPDENTTISTRFILTTGILESIFIVETTLATIKTLL